jgi:hypothetical protein
MFFYFVVYQNNNVSMHHISSCIMLSCIMVYHQHKSYGTYILCKEGWGNFQNDHMDIKLYK